MKKIIITCLFALSFSYTALYAWVVPGTIQKWGYSSSIECGKDTSSYNPSGGYCYSGGCDAYEQLPKTCAVTNASACGTHATPVGCSGTGCTGSAPNTCNVTSATYCGTYNGSCIDHKWYAAGNGNLLFNNYYNANANPSYGSSSSNQKLGIDLTRTCSHFAQGTAHTPPTMGGTYSCEYSSINYYVGWANGACYQYGSMDNLISTFDQYGAISTTTSSDSDNTCMVEGRYATPDNVGPNVAVWNVSVIFDGDENHWCDMEKYLAANYGTSTNPELTGCKYYRNKNPNITGSLSNPDLLKGLELTVSDVSGVSSVQIEIGACDTTYTLPSGITSILTGPQGSIKSAYTSFTLSYNTSTIVDGTTLPGLLEKFGKTRLDACFTEGKNFLRVTMRDSARSDYDGVSHAGNVSIYDYSTQNKFVKIDTTSPKLQISGDAKKFYESNTATSCFIGGATLDPNWKNYTISGSLQSGDPYGNNAPDCSVQCTVLSGSTLSCVGHANVSGVPNIGGANPSDPIYASPGNIHPTTGIFTGYMCDGLGPNPNTNSCDWWCKIGYEKDVVTKTCVPTGSKMFILFDAGAPEISWNYSAKLTSDPNDSRGLLASESVACSTPAYAISSTKYKTFTYSAGAEYGPFATLPAPNNSKKWPIIAASETNCSPVCPQNYHAAYGSGGGTCTPSTKNVQCALPVVYVNTVWNMKGYISQTWNGSAWSPGLPPTTYSAVVGGNDSQCYYKCATGYSWNGTQCTPVTHGVCWSDDGQTLASSPNNLCSVGNPSTVSGAGPWTWSCASTNGWTTASCSANKTATVNYCTAGGTVPCVVP